jgi:gamma-glutamylcyclotransferase (GGCT)/AIG2-like uncharacterized protein YtfP
MLKNDLLFVYGTLRAGERMDIKNQKLNAEVTFISKDKINGNMYHLGTFPGVKEVNSRFDPNDPIVIGEVFKIRGSAIIAILDAYESYNADNPSLGLYDRCQVTTERGRLVWVYTFNGMVIPEQRIESGDWCRNRQTLGSGRSLSAWGR